MKKCITIPDYYKKTGNKVSEHERCYQVLPSDISLSDQELSESVMSRLFDDGDELDEATRKLISEQIVQDVVEDIIEEDQENDFDDDDITEELIAAQISSNEVNREAPNKTVKAYKLFRVDPRKPGQLFPLFVDSKTAVPKGEWIPAISPPYFVGDVEGKATRQGTTDPSKGRKYVKAKTGSNIVPKNWERERLLEEGEITKLSTKTIKAVALRPGWHSGDGPFSSHLGAEVKGISGNTRRPSHHVWAEVEVGADVDWQPAADSQAGLTNEGNIDVAEAYVQQLPTGGFYRYKTSANMTGNWMISDNVKVLRVLSDAEVKEINDELGFEDLPRVDANGEPYGEFTAEDAAKYNTHLEVEEVAANLFQEEKELEPEVSAISLATETQPEFIDIDPSNYDVIEGEIVNTTRAVQNPKDENGKEYKLVSDRIEEASLDKLLQYARDNPRKDGQMGKSIYNSYEGEVAILATKEIIDGLNEQGQVILEEMSKGMTKGQKTKVKQDLMTKEEYKGATIVSFMSTSGHSEYLESEEFESLSLEDKVGYLQKVRDDYKEEIKNNLRLYYDKWTDFPDAMVLRENAKLWYVGANKLAQDMAKRYDISLEQAAGVLATQSPQKDWFQNIEQANRVIHLAKLNPVLDATTFDTLHENLIKGRPSGKVGGIPKKFNAARKYLEGKRLLDIKEGMKIGKKKLSAEEAAELRGIMLAGYDLANNNQYYRVYEPDGNIGDFARTDKGEYVRFGYSSGTIVGNGIDIVIDKNTLTDRLGVGNKVRNFYNNIVNPNYDSVTIDTHAEGAAMNHSFNADLAGASKLFSSSAYGGKGVYWEIRDAYREVADELGIQARELQSITWEAIRLMMTDAEKPGVRSILNEFYKKGDVIGARNYMMSRRINRPSWSPNAAISMINEATVGTSWEGMTLAEIKADPRGYDFLREKNYI